jgi:hypothetical protein
METNLCCRLCTFAKKKNPMDKIFPLVLTFVSLCVRSDFFWPILGGGL